MNTQSSQRSIDSSLARSIRRGYFRRLAREWAAYDQRRGRAAGRNVSLSAWMDTRRQFRGTYSASPRELLTARHQPFFLSRA